jgi:pyruvate dehydrogenase E1 component alpha subunit
MEAVAERFRGHSISDPASYRTKEALQSAMESKDPIQLFKSVLTQHKVMDEELFKKMDAEQKQRVIEAMKYAETSPPPNVMSLEEGVFAD